MNVASKKRKKKLIAPNQPEMCSWKMKKSLFSLMFGWFLSWKILVKRTNVPVVSNGSEKKEGKQNFGIGCLLVEYSRKNKTKAKRENKDWNGKIENGTFLVSM